MSFFDKLKLMPTIWRAMREAKKQGLSREDALSEALVAGVGQAAKQDGLDDEKAQEYKGIVQKALSGVNEIDVPEDCIRMWEDYDPYNDQDSDNFDFSPIHLKMIRALCFEYDGAEAGAPTISSRTPYGSNDLFEDLGKISGFSDKAKLAKLHTELYQAMIAFLIHAKLSEGTYKFGNTDPALVRDVDGSEIDDDGNVTVTPDQIAALRMLVWEWVDSEDIKEQLSIRTWPVLRTDPKRPYGALSYYQTELAGILGWDMEKDGDGNFITSPQQDEQLATIHNGLFGAIQVFFENAELAPGVYEL